MSSHGLKVAAPLKLLSLCAGIAVIAIAIAPLGAQHPVDSPVSAPPPPSEAATRGQATFGASCSFCHGAKGNGTEQAPNLMRSPLLIKDHDGDVLVPFLAEGRPGLGMPSFASLQPAQRADIAAFLHYQQTQQVHRRRLPESAALVGDAAAGKAYFNGAGKCSTCHSVTGDLAGIGSKLQPLALTSSFLTPTPKPLKVTVTPLSGPAVTGILDYQDEFTVSMNDTAGTYHSWPRSHVKSVDVVDPLEVHRKMLPLYTDKNIHDLLSYLVTIK